MTQIPQLDREDIRLLVEIGFLAAGRGLLSQAEAIFTAVLLLRPDKAVGYVGMAMALLNAGRAADAIICLQEARLPTGEEDDLVRAFQGLALQLDRRAFESVGLLRALAYQPLPAAGATEGMLLARRLLGEPPD